ncbi:hypothetical protein QJS10_CPA09g01791 [Acorus calamus]|uniref:Uncharacterized protein n=1 Tax=Acorus calamus TaxID=4465 RepID=A0AAV9E3C6_ACOCL|nr:hypothetical protein QJS10_CPA09g01791 [Acorus calamus]
MEDWRFVDLLVHVADDTLEKIFCVGLKRANEIIGTTTEKMESQGGCGLTGERRPAGASVRERAARVGLSGQVKMREMRGRHVNSLDENVMKNKETE